MRPAPVCPRCGLQVHPPGAWSSAWTCEAHGPVDPLQPAPNPSSELVLTLARQATLPVWLPWPLPGGWVVTGIRTAGDDRTGPRAVALACCGPAPLGGMGELVLVAESPGVGLGAGLAGLDGLDPGAEVTVRAADAKVVADHRPTALWSVAAASDRAVFVGEAFGHWLWVLLWPGAAGDLMVEQLRLVDLREVGIDLALPIGALSPRLTHSAAHS